MAKTYVRLQTHIHDGVIFVEHRDDIAWLKIPFTGPDAASHEIVFYLTGPEHVRQLIEDLEECLEELEEVKAP
jgi:hypothetical protein